jgi:Caspase domain
MPRMRFARGMCVGVVLVSVYASGAPAQDQCNLAKDIVVQALERIKTGTNKEAGDGVQLLKHATEVCISDGDAWYYRAIFEKKLGQSSKSDYSLKKAKMFGSEAMDQGADPFQLATAPGTPKPAEAGPVHEKWALVVGISRFQDKRLGRLNFASKDAKDFAAVLVDPSVGRFNPSNVHSLVDGEVTTRQLKQELNWLARSANDPNDLVVIFLASHGTPRNKDTAEVNYIATSDTEVEPEDNLFATALPMVQISDIVRSRIKAQRTVILLDTCHSGAAVANSSARLASLVSDSAVSNDALDRIRQGIGRAVVTSSSPDEKSYEGQPYSNGYFTHFLLEELKKNGGQDSIEQIYASLKVNVSRAASSIQHKQTPVFSHSERGAEIVIGASPSGGQ